MFALNEIENLSSAFNGKSIYWKDHYTKSLDRFKKLQDKDVRGGMLIYFN